MNNLHKIQISPICNSTLCTTAISKVTSSVVITLGDVKKLRESFSVSERDVIDAIADQQVVEAKRQIVSKLPSSLLGDSQVESGSVQDDMSLGSISDIEQQIQLMRTKSQKGTKYLRMMGIVEERISPEND